jgi:hypothetical protein
MVPYMKFLVGLLLRRIFRGIPNPKVKNNHALWGIATRPQLRLNSRRNRWHNFPLISSFPLVGCILRNLWAMQGDDVSFNDTQRLLLPEPSGLGVVSLWAIERHYVEGMRVLNLVGDFRDVVVNVASHSERR